MRLSRRIVVLVSGAALLAPLRSAAQEPAASGAVTGAVVAAESQRPLAGAQVVLQGAPLGVLTTGAGRLPLFLGESLAATTDSAGVYRFSELPAGRYRMYVYSLGYRPATLEIRLTGREVSQLSVGLRVATVELQPMVVTAEAGDPFGAPSTPAPADELAAAGERLRQRRYLAPDTRAITRADVEQAVTLGESDLFRALQRLPGVTTRDDYTTELWTRGAPWDQTVVYFDGVPLFNPLHAAGAVSAVNPDAVGAVFFHPGVQPSERSGGAAGVVDLRTRRGAADATRASAEVSLLSTRAAADDQALDGRVGWMVAARRSHLDLLSRGELPYWFGDVAGRVDLRLDPARRVEVSGLHEVDRLDGEVRGVVRDAAARWGSSAGRVTVALPLLGGELRHTVGGSRFFARGEGAGPAAGGHRFPRGEPPTEGAYRAPPLDNGVSYLAFESVWESPRLPRGAQLSLGWGAETRRARFRTTGLWPYRTGADEPVQSAQALRLGVLWGEVEGEVLPRLRLEAGGRLEVSPRPLFVTGHVRAAPRLAVRYEVTPELSLSAAGARSYQYAQALTPAGPGYDGVAVSGLFWTLPDETAAALRSDVLTLGAERWLGEATLLSATVYRREVEGVRVPDPRPGWLEDRPLSVPARSHAAGLDLSLRRLTGRWTGSAAYSLNATELETAEHRFAAPTSRRHVAELGAMLRVGRGVRAGGAFTAASGVRFTRYEGVLQECGEEGEGCRFVTFARAPGGEQAPTYRSLDLLADWNGTLRGWRVGAYAQLRNVLRRENAGAYRFSRVFCTRRPGEACHDILDAHQDALRPEMNRFLPGLPFVPFVGVRVSF